jgi:phosphoglycerate dehydrogenase-like enzyme
MAKRRRKLFVELHSSVRALNIRSDVMREIECRLPELTFEYLSSQAELQRRIAEPHYAACWNFPASLYRRAKNLRAVFTPAAGRDWVDRDPDGRVATYYGSFHGAMISESLLAMMLYFNNRFGTTLSRKAAREFDRDMQMPRTRLAQHRVLIVGYGNIGVHCARLLRGFGCTVVGTKRSPRATRDRRTGARLVPFSRLMDELPLADHVVDLLPGDTSTKGLINRRHFAAMRAGAWFYNFGRGTSVNESDLVDALKRGRMAGAGLDVFEREPLPARSPLWQLDNVLITPHSSCCYSEYGRLFAHEMAGRLRRLLARER